MNVVAWSQNLTAERAEEFGATLVSKEHLFAEADVLSIHLVLSPRTKEIVDAKHLALMKHSALLANTSRGPLVDEAALLEELESGRIGKAAIDVYDLEPLPADHPIRTAKNLLATPHIGYVAGDLYKVFYRDTAAHVRDWLGRQGTESR